MAKENPLNERNWKIQGYTPSKQYQFTSPVQKIVDEINSLLQEHKTLKEIYNKYANIRNTAAEIPQEYLKGVHLDGQIDEQDLRYLIIRGCDKIMEERHSELDNVEYKLLNIKYKFNNASTLSTQT